MIVKANSNLSSGLNPFTNCEINVFCIRSRSNHGRQYQLRVEDNQAYTGFKIYTYFLL